MELFQQNERSRLNLTESCLRCGTAIVPDQPCTSCITRLKQHLGELNSERSYYGLKNQRAHKGIAILSRYPWLEMSGLSSRQFTISLKVRLRHLVNYLGLCSGEVESIYVSETKHILSELLELKEHSSSLIIMLESLEESVLYQHLITHIMNSEMRLVSQQLSVKNFLDYRMGGALTIRHLLLIATIFSVILTLQYYLFRINGLI
jgi:hypothetical protein